MDLLVRTVLVLKREDFRSRTAQVKLLTRIELLDLLVSAAAAVPAAAAAATGTNVLLVPAKHRQQE